MQHTHTHTHTHHCPHVGNDTRAYCMYCKSDFWAKMSDIKKHVATQKHTQKAKPYNSATQSTLPVIHQKLDKARKAEATIAMAVVVFAAFVKLFIPAIY